MTPETERSVVIVRGSGEGFAQDITAGPHRLMADEPVAAGGTDRGPDHMIYCWPRSVRERR